MFLVEFFAYVFKVWLNLEVKAIIHIYIYGLILLMIWLGDIYIYIH